MPRFQKVTQTTLIAGFGVIMLLVLGYIVYHDQFARFDVQHLKADPNFTYTDTLSCHVEYSTFKKIGEALMDIYAERDFTLSNLNTDQPKLRISNFELALKKIRESNNAITLQTEPLAPDDTSIQTIQVLKDRGTFVRAYMGTSQYFGAREKYFPDLFQNIIAQKGRCE
ncbi:MAG: hypothetical protein PHH01_02035 [Patescibacteria group bacterium]|nr:hypothetical protein [Patescibacteria group bacterium]